MMALLAKLLIAVFTALSVDVCKIRRCCSQQWTHVNVSLSSGLFWAWSLLCSFQGRWILLFPCYTMFYSSVDAWFRSRGFIHSTVTSWSPKYEFWKCMRYGSPVFRYCVHCQMESKTGQLRSNSSLYMYSTVWVITNSLSHLTCSLQVWKLVLSLFGSWIGLTCTERSHCPHFISEYISKIFLHITRICLLTFFVLFLWSKFVLVVLEEDANSFLHDSLWATVCQLMQTCALALYH